MVNFNISGPATISLVSEVLRCEENAKVAGLWAFQNSQKPQRLDCFSYRRVGVHLPVCSSALSVVLVRVTAVGVSCECAVRKTRY